MPVECAACGSVPFPHHFALEARARARWRGKSFDADAAMGNIGLAVADVLGVSPREFDAFQKRVRVRAFREDVDENPSEAFDPEAGERWEFHVAFVEDVDVDVVSRAREAAVNALEGSRNYEGVRVIASQA